MIPVSSIILTVSCCVGVLAIQGDFEMHLQALAAIQVESCEVRTEEDLAKCTHLIIPGGESTTVGKLLERFSLGVAIRARAEKGMPIWGTCMGMIMLAQNIEDSDQYTLALLDITVRRNAYGAQVHSFETPVPVSGLEEPVMGVFIRAPIVTKFGSSVQVLSVLNGNVVGVRQGSILGTSFHPELTEDRRLHAWFASMEPQA